MKKIFYMAPELEFVELMVEQGFAASLDAGSNDYVDGGELEELP